MKYLFAGTAAIISTLVSVPSYGQTADTSVQRTESRTDSIDVAEKRVEVTLKRLTRDTETVKPFTFTATLPFTYSSNVEYADGGQKKAMHGVPSLRLDWKKPDGVVVRRQNIWH